MRQTEAWWLYRGLRRSGVELPPSRRSVLDDILAAAEAEALHAFAAEVLRRCLDEPAFGDQDGLAAVMSLCLIYENNAYQLRLDRPDALEELIDAVRRSRPAPEDEIIRRLKAMARSLD